MASRHRPAQPSEIPPRPPDWHLTISDLHEEMAAGKRASLGMPEIAWAREYELSLMPEGTRFPQKGDVYEARHDQTIEYLTHWSAPFTSGGVATLFKGEQIWIPADPPDERPLAVNASPVAYDALEARMVPPRERKRRSFLGFSIYVSTADLNEHFTLVGTGFTGPTE